LTDVSVKLAFVLLFCFILTSLRTVWEYFERTVVKKNVLQIFKHTIIQEDNQNGGKFTIATGSCCLHTRGSSICNPSFHKVLGLKKIPPLKGQIPEPEKVLCCLQEQKSDAKLC